MISILIPTLESRKPVFERLLHNLIDQFRKSNTEVKTNATQFNGGYLEKYEFSNGEIIVYCDNKQVTTGEKRNVLLRESSCEYIVMIDDDDWIEPYYVDEMIKGCESGADCMAINGIITTNGKNLIKWKISKDYQDIDSHENGQKIYLRRTNHITAVKRELALKAGFPNKSNAEDKDYSSNLFPLLKTEHKIDKPMYWYRFENFNKAYK